MPKLSAGELKGILQAEKSDALSAMQAAKLSTDRSKAMDYYNGEVPDMPSEPGRSKAVSTDVSDTIEGLMPSFMEIFCSGDEIMRFEPVGEEDVKAAEQETDYINHVFMQQNPGFLILYSMIKDALLSKVGVVKVWWEEEEQEEEETYCDLDDGTLAVLLDDPNVSIVKHTVKDAPGEPATA